jgi:hypothetical protein
VAGTPQGHEDAPPLRRPFVPDDVRHVVRAVGVRQRVDRPLARSRATGALSSGVSPTLPTALCERRVNREQKCPKKTDKTGGDECEGRDLNPYRSYPTGT